MFTMVIRRRQSLPGLSLSGTGDALDRSTIREATRNFSEANVIGEGGYSVVYRGQLRDGTMVAVKRLKKYYLTDKGKEDFSREVGVMSTLRHVNLAKLLYYCREEDEWILVYELMENRSLNLYIFGTRCNA
uniref:Protein kinase domain-containing protein n=1 Tax=Aegilops tauschii subsp. strangulata TaxID=200361 RepID=A0A453D3C6_AEGTS